MTKFVLFYALASSMTKGSNSTIAINGHVGSVMGIEREDGSGSCFIVKLRNAQGDTEVFVRTID